jgi:hypothetical protein
VRKSPKRYGDDRQANRARSMITICRLRNDDNTGTYLQLRATEGKTRSEAVRCVTSYVHHTIRTDPADA